MAGQTNTHTHIKTKTPLFMWAKYRPLETRPFFFTFSLHDDQRQEHEERQKPELHTDLTTTAAIALYRSIVGSIIRIFVKVL